MKGYPRVCANCKWWVPTCEDGACHRYPPTVINEDVSLFPMTDCDGSCGEFSVMQHLRITSAATGRFAEAPTPALGA